MKTRTTNPLGQSKGKAKNRPRRRWGRLAPLLVIAGIVLYCSVSHFDFRSALTQPGHYAALEVQHPIEGAIMPFNMPAPVLLWKTNVLGVGRWEAVFEIGRWKWSFKGIQPMWCPPETEWRQIKQGAKGGPVELTITGYEEASPSQLKAQGSVHFVVARETVTAPLFYREVNLPFQEAVKDPTKIRWRFGSLEMGPPPAVLERLPVCGNCHSFTRNGEYLAMDVDYANSKASYIITKTAPEMRLATSDIITWDDYRRNEGQQTFGLLSQISPDGRYVLSTVKDISLFMARPNLAFSQLFFPLKGILAVYDRETKQFSSLPGADDPAFVQSNPTWSPDGRQVLFARNRAAEVKTNREPGRVLLLAEEGEEFLRRIKEFRYDLYRVPFNGGKGGKAEPLRGASGNGRSNYFPKYSPDGRWIVFCQAANYMLLQPDSELFIIPAEGGEARRLGCNLGRMNSWHSWSPDGRWLVFSSKAHSDYTQLYLARMSAQGEAAPPVWLAHMVETNRAANIPEFVALPTNALVKIREQFLDDLSYVRAGDEFYRAGEMDPAIEKYKIALSLNPDNVAAHERLVFAYSRVHAPDPFQEHLQAVVRLAPHNSRAQFLLGDSLARGGNWSKAIVHFREALRWLPNNADRSLPVPGLNRPLPEALHYHLGAAQVQMGKLAEAEKHLRAALRLAPDYPEAQYDLGTLLLGAGRLAEAGERFTVVIKLMPENADAYNCLGIIRQRQHRRSEALTCFQQAIRYNANDWQAHLNLAYAYLFEGNRDKAIPELREALRLKPDCAQAQQALVKALGPSRLKPQ